MEEAQLAGPPSLIAGGKASGAADAKCAGRSFTPCDAKCEGSVVAIVAGDEVSSDGGVSKPAASACGCGAWRDSKGRKEGPNVCGATRLARACGRRHRRAARAGGGGGTRLGSGRGADGVGVEGRVHGERDARARRRRRLAEPKGLGQPEVLRVQARELREARLPAGARARAT